MRFPGSIRGVVPGIGRILSHRFDINEEMRHCRERLAKDSEVLDVLRMPGWTKIQAEYNRLLIHQLNSIRELCKNTNRFREEIQRRSDLMEACQRWLILMTVNLDDMDKTARYEDRLRRHKIQTGVV